MSASTLLLSLNPLLINYLQVFHICIRMLLLLLGIKNCFDLSSVFTMPPFCFLPQNIPALFRTHLIPQKTLKRSKDSYYENQPVKELSCKQKTQEDQINLCHILGMRLNLCDTVCKLELNYLF